MATSDPKAMIGQWIPGGFRIKKFVGAGAFAWVYLAQNARGDQAAIKVLQSPATDEARTLFSREIKVLRALPRNPYCVAYIDDGITDEGMSFVTMEFVDGATLKDSFKFKPTWEASEACELMVQMCDALAPLHRLGVAHRDLKPENVMITRDGQVKVMDFGLVKDAQGLLKLFETEDILTGRDFAENIDRAMLAGTPEYMAPEQFSDPMIEDESQAQTDTWSDVYSLGLILFQLLTGEKLFPFKPTSRDQGGYAREMLAYIKLRTSFDDEELHCPVNVPTELWPTVVHALRQSPKQRYHNAVEFGDAVRRYLESGRSDDFTDNEHTSMADMSMLLASLTPPPPTAGPDPKRPRSVRPPAPTEAATDARSTPPPVDVGAVQAYRDERLNRPGRADYTLPPGAVFADQLAPRGIQPGADANAGGPTATTAAAAPATAARQGSLLGTVGLAVGGLLVAAVAAVATYVAMTR